MKALHILGVILLINTTCLSQSCKDFHKRRDCVSTEGKGFNLYGQSRSKVIELGSSTAYQVVLYGRKDYIFSFCTERNLYPLHYKITDVETEKVLFDNIEDDYIESIGFTVDETITVNIEMSVLAKGFEPGSFTENRGCLGLLILWRKTPKIGF